MSYDIVLGRNQTDKEKFGNKGLIFLGKGYVKMGVHTSLSNNIWLDVARNHIILVAGKRGSGKSYTLGAIAEELSCLPQESARNIASLIFDTMGIFWTMKFKNEKDKELLDKWGIKAKNLPVKVFVPYGKAEEYKKKSIAFDSTFALMPSELETEDWLSLFNLDLTSITGVFITRIIAVLKKTSKSFTLTDIQKAIEADKKAKEETKEIASSLFSAAESWGIFSSSSTGTEVGDLINAGKTTILDISVYSSVGAFNIRALVIALISRKLFQSRMDSRKKEEFEAIQHGQDYLSIKSAKQEPLIWLFIDEAHEFLPKEGKTPATDALVQLLREGRQPGISMVMATQQPGKIHSDAMTQSDIVISHRVTSKQDVEALNEIMQSYVLEGIKKQIDNLPPEKGSAIILDDNSERIYPIQVRPKFTWHGGEAPTAIKVDVKV
jgi:DNA helicase HerA-like ATPase